MNTDGKMSFRDFVFPINPSFIRIFHSRKISRQKIPFGNNAVTDMGKNGRTISGEGEFCGENCIEDFERLKKVFETGGGGMLYIPSQKPIYAVFSSLELLAQDINGVIKYSFEFTESFEKSLNEHCTDIISDGKSSLWDISYRYSVRIEELLRLNPSVRRPDFLIEKGKRVTLC